MKLNLLDLKMTMFVVCSISMILANTNPNLSQLTPEDRTDSAISRDLPGRALPLREVHASNLHQDCESGCTNSERHEICLLSQSWRGLRPALSTGNPMRVIR